MDAKRKLGEILSAFEFLDNMSMDLVRSLHPYFLLWIVDNLIVWDIFGDSFLI